MTRASFSKNFFPRAATTSCACDGTDRVRQRFDAGRSGHHTDRVFRISCSKRRLHVSRRAPTNHQGNARPKPSATVTLKSNARARESSWRKPRTGVRANGDVHSGHKSPQQQRMEKHILKWSARSICPKFPRGTKAVRPQQFQAARLHRHPKGREQRSRRRSALHPRLPHFSSDASMRDRTSTRPHVFIYYPDMPAGHRPLRDRLSPNANYSDWGQSHAKSTNRRSRSD